jgi:hypothetical protein
MLYSCLMTCGLALSYAILLSYSLDTDLEWKRYMFRRILLPTYLLFGDFSFYN